MKEWNLRKSIYWLASSLVFFILIFVISVLFLNPSSVGNQNFIWFFNLWAFVWAVNFVIILTLSFVLGRNLVKYFFERQGNQPGTRIKNKLVLTFIIFSLFPALIMFFAAFGLINQNLAQWVSAPSEKLLESSQQISREFYEEKKASVLAAAHFLASQLASGDLQIDSGLEEAIRRYRLESLTLLAGDGTTLYRSKSWFQDLPLAEVLHQVRNGNDYFQLQLSINLEPGMVDRGVVAVAVPNHQGGHPAEIVAAQFTVPESVAFQASEVEQASRAYRELQNTMTSLRINYFSILLLTALAVVFGFVWLGNYIARKLSVPLEALAEGSRELAGGNLNYRVNARSVDELGVLVDSFNRMAEQITESRRELEQTNRELQATNVRLDQRRQFIETILQNIATGVLSVDEGEVIRTVNEAALKMLQLERPEILGRTIRQVTTPGLYQEFQVLKRRAEIFGTYRKQVTFQRRDQRLHVAATVTCNPLPLQDGVKYLVVLDDLTELIRTEKFAAWQEVARRLAHEIKNPLTPIQLSAERIRKRFDRIRPSLSEFGEVEGFDQMLQDATRIITAEAGMLKDLVEEFSRFARLPICRPVPVNLQELLDQTFELYNGILDAVQLEKHYDSRITAVSVDPDQMRRVFVNLIDNAMDALAETVVDRRLQVTTALNSERQSVTIEFADNGSGIGPEDYEHLFLPYFSTKKKGTGLGLAIVRQIISEHHGFIRAEPNLPRGIRVILELPA